jgi:hypothetical protein
MESVATIRAVKHQANQAHFWKTALLRPTMIIGYAEKVYVVLYVTPCLVRVLQMDLFMENQSADSGERWARPELVRNLFAELAYVAVVGDIEYTGDAMTKCRCYWL